MSTTLDWVRELIPEAQAWQHEMVATNIDGLYTKYYDANDDLYQAKRHIESLRAQVEALKSLLQEKLDDDGYSDFTVEEAQEAVDSGYLRVNWVVRVLKALRGEEG